MSNLEKHLGQRLPLYYLTFITEVKKTNNDGYVNDYIVFYLEESEVIEMDHANETRKYLPNFLGIGNGSGGREILISFDHTDEKIYLGSHGAFFLEDLEVIALSLSDFKKSNYDLKD
jgi:hypothetical protein